jgi:hypothetical protein
MARHGKISAYLSQDPEHSGRLVVTGWPGFVLAAVTAHWQTSAGGFCRGHEITRFHAVDRLGQAWAGSGPGEGTYCRMRRISGRGITRPWHAARAAALPAVLEPIAPPAAVTALKREIARRTAGSPNVSVVVVGSEVQS